MPEFKIGDVVRLKSGGPEMTVTSPCRDDGYVSCEWFSGGDCHHWRWMPPESLEAATIPTFPPTPEQIGMTPGKWTIIPTFPPTPEQIGMTPGKWTIIPAFPPTPEQIGMTPWEWTITCNAYISSLGYGVVCAAPAKTCTDSLKHWPANARAICQVPAMVELLEEMTGGIVYGKHHYEKAQSILKAIKGDP